MSLINQDKNCNGLRHIKFAKALYLVVILHKIEIKVLLATEYSEHTRYQESVKKQSGLALYCVHHPTSGSLRRNSLHRIIRDDTLRRAYRQ